MGERLDDDRQHGRRDDRDQHGALHTAHVENKHQEEPEHEHEGRPAVEGTGDAELDGGRTRADDASVDQSDEGNEEAQTHRDRGLERGRHRAEHGLAESREDQEEDEDALPGDDSHGLAVAQTGAEDERKSDDRVQAQAGGERQRVVGDNTHEDRHDACDEGGAGGDPLGGDGAVSGDRVAEDRRVNNQDVSHREEGHDASANLVADGRAARGNLEERID